MTKKAATAEHIKDLKPDQKNARRHNPRNIGTIADALNDVGAARSIVIDEENNILAGNGTVEAAAQAGITTVKVVEADGNTIIAVRRTGLSKAQKRRLAIADNRTAELAEWDTDVLRELADTEPEALTGMFTPDELGALIDEQEAARIETITVERPTDIAWVLVGIPLSEWPKHQKAVESLQAAALFTTQVLRPKGDAAPKKPEARRAR